LLVLAESMKTCWNVFNLSLYSLAVVTGVGSVEQKWDEDFRVLHCRVEGPICSFGGVL
jgi:hypothetical protein